jgi:hypothetical protein
MLCDWCSSEELCKRWSKMCNKGYTWNNIEITWDEDVDYYVIINKPPPNEYYMPEKTLVFQMEPWVYDENKTWGVKTWGNWAKPNPNKFMHVHSHDKYLNNVEWQINIPQEFPKVRKEEIFSILSGNNWDDGHKKRTKFVKYLEENEKDILIDVYGRSNYHNLKNYKGQLTDDKKESQFVNYKYYFMAENNSEHNYATEKIWEPILCECLCFYWGCPNLEDYIDERAFVRLDLDDFEKSYQIIKQAIEEDWWSQRIDIIKKEKEKIINEFGFFPTLQRIINEDINRIQKS